MPKLSVHLITYNNQDHIRETLDSIINQATDIDYEIVIGDDNSTDSTWEIITKYQKDHQALINAKRNKKQLGILLNFKETLDRCKGNYVFAIAGDDYLIDDHALEKMVEVFNANPEIGFLDSGYNNFNEKTAKTKTFVNRDLMTTSKENYLKRLKLGHITPIGICFNRDLLYTHVDFNHYIKEDITIDDYPILVDLAMNSDFARIAKPLVAYRSHESSYSHSRSFNDQFFMKMQMKKLFDHFSKKYEFEKRLIEEYESQHYKDLLFLAGYFENKELGEKSFRKLKNKAIRNYIHYYASKYKIFRKAISII
ncbi:MAG: glycosyltransferase family 2 protein [Flavobacteriaceae bacterium]|nr:glycosyltransferase family 2 protein [Flavobacteriaceae bacterium]